MKLLAFTDTHENPQVLKRIKDAIKSEKPDIAVCVGDFTIFGRSTKRMMEELNSLGIKLILIHGNHDDEEEILELLPTCPNIIWVHKEVIEINGFRFMGFGGGGFRREEPELEEFEKEQAALFDEKTIFLCHAPPHNTALDEVEPEWHVGNASLSALIKRRRPLLVLSGHIHECFHIHDELAGTTLINPGPDGEIIELEE